LGWTKLRILLKRKITDIKVQRRNSSRRTLFFDDESVFGLSEDVFISENFKIGDVLSEEKFRLLQNSESQNKVKEAAFRLLSFRMRSVAEIQGRLRKKGYLEEEITPVLDQLIDMRYLNDEEFTIAFCRDKIRNKHIGPTALRSELAVHRLDQELISEVFTELYNEESIRNLIKYHLNRKKVEEGTHLEQKEKTKLLSLLQRKGFSWSDISSVFDELEIQ